ncbi:efflux RND transporter permease subunit [Roseivirga echinicomitans]|uniref:Multidrug transporter n=1 Tax=Roseivirga echinicomitans TaxID=296218 RepID=A0A150XDB7_9BACT|nr:efflux RND transporter permease subunit [Roseivirga echinicomitans]KYG76692.1 multidrug transporter [Roseivirga echinicomitans]
MKRPFRMVIVFVVLAMIGIAFIPKLNVNFTPRYTKPAITISFTLPDSSPDIVERLATSPLENAISQIEGVNKVTSVSGYSTGSIELSFDKGEDMEFRKFEINSLIRNIYKKLPETMSYPMVEQRGGETQNQSESPILLYSINGPYASYKIKKDVDEYILKPLSAISEIKRTELTGANELQITVDFDPLLLMRYGLSKSDIVSSLNLFQDRNYPGMIKNPAGQQFYFRSSSELTSLEDLEQAVISNIEGKELYLKDIAKVYLEEQEPRSYTRINGRNAINLQIYAREGVNKIVLAKQIRDRIEELQSTVQSDLSILLEQDDTEFLNKEMDKIYQRTSLSIIILLVFIFLINRNPRYLATLFMGIAVNLCITAIILYALDVELHMYSIAGLTISFGLIVDNAIVMMDHMYRKKNRGIFVALLAASLTTIMALLMVLLLPEEDRRNLSDFSIVVAINLAVSLLIALFFTPALYQLLFKKEIQKSKLFSTRQLRRKVKWFKGYSKSIGFVVRYRKAFIVIVILGFGLPVFKIPIQWEGQEWYNKTIGSDKYQDDIRPITDKILGGAMRKFATEVYQGYYYRDVSQTQLTVRATLPMGTTLEDANYVIGKVEEFVDGVKGIDKYITRVDNRTGTVRITFEPEYEFSALPYQLKGRLQARSVDLTGVQWSIVGVGQGFNIGGERGESQEFGIRMRGYNYDELSRQADILAVKLENHKRIQEVKTNEQIGYNYYSLKGNEYVLYFDVDRMAKAGISRGAVTNVLIDYTLPNSSSASANLNNERTPIFVKAMNAKAFSKYDLMEEALPIDTSRLVKINDYATMVFEESANQIHKEDRQYLRQLGFKYLGSGKFGAEYRDKMIEEMKLIMPVGYQIDTQDRLFRFDKQTKQYGLLGYLIIGIFIICAILFENLKQPLFIIITIPISFIGLFLIFSLFDFSFDQGGYAAFVMLGGLVVNAAIFIVNDLNNSSLKKYNRAVLRAVIGKAQPIMLTILSTCFGLIPFLLEGENEAFWFALAIGTIGGLMFSTVAVFLCLPVFLTKKVKRA